MLLHRALNLLGAPGRRAQLHHPHVRHGRRPGGPALARNHADGRWTETSIDFCAARRQNANMYRRTKSCVGSSTT
ncbi:hypothetical protein ACFVZ3_17460 [Kitasatospora purpeofusca]|uniref:hypothetical protein n=1 Tax=Kitasatospora purpeofusca TaxID=67352 RepID=UPI0036C2528E